MNLPLFPLRVVLFPGMTLPLHIFEPRYRAMINLCVTEGRPFGVALLRSGAEVGGEAEPYPVGTSARLVGVERLPDGRMNIETVGEERFRILALHHDESYLTGTVEAFPLTERDLPAARAGVRVLLPHLTRYLNLLGEATTETFDLKRLPADPVALAYLAAILVQVPLEEKQTLLAQPSVVELLTQERVLYRRETSLLRVMLNHRQGRNKATFLPN